MKKIDDFIGLDGLSDDDFIGIGVDLLNAGETIYGLTLSTKEIISNTQKDKPEIVNTDLCAEMVLKHPLLAIGIVFLARSENFHFHFLEGSHTHNQLLQVITEFQSVIAEKVSDIAESSDFMASEKGA